LDSTKVPAFNALGKAQYMDAIDVEKPVAAEMKVPEPEVRFSLEEYTHYCEMFDRLLTELKSEDWVVVKEMRPESLKGSAAQHTNTKVYMDEFDRHEIREMRARFSTPGWPCTYENVQVGEESLEYNDVLTDSYSPEGFLKSLSEADRRDLLLRAQNKGDLRAIQKVILFEEERVLSLDETLTRVLSFYGRFVPFRQTKL